jgi:hypothetical protein
MYCGKRLMKTYMYFSLICNMHDAVTIEKKVGALAEFFVTYYNGEIASL